MRIYLFDLYHNGDLVMNQPIVRNLCENNPEHDFFMCTNYNSHIFSNIPRLTYINLNEPQHSRIAYVCSKYGTKCYDRENEGIFINLWIGAAFSTPVCKVSQSNIECQPYNHIMSLQHIFDEIYNRFRIKLKINPTNMMPIIPYTDITKFTNWYENHKNSNLIFYYNYAPKSGQYMPTSDHNSVILYLAQTIPDSYILVPNIPTELNSIMSYRGMTNIINCVTEFDCYENISCENLSKLIKITEYCNYSIHFDIGSCFYYFNSNIFSSKNTILHVGISSYYYLLILNNFSEPERQYISNKIKMVESNDNVHTEVVKHINNISI